jgi:transposase
MFVRRPRYIERERLIIRLIERGVSYCALAERFGITRAAIATLLWRYRRRELRLT